METRRVSPGINPPPSGARALAWRGGLGRHGFPLSDAATAAVATYAAGSLWAEGRVPPYAVGVIPLAWIAVAAGAGSILPRGRAWLSGCLAFALAPGAALLLRTLSSGLSARQATAFALFVALGLACMRLFAGLIARGRDLDGWEGARLAAAQAASLFAVHPYLRSALVGAGDAASYSLSIADFLVQARAGVFPVLAGQSAFAFHGGFQPLRNAPYLVHLAWAIDHAGLGTLSVFAVQNLTVGVSMAGGILGCYAALRLTFGGMPWRALALAVLYGLCPGVLAPLYAGDMYPTFMTLPFIPWLVMGIARAAEVPDRPGPWMLQGGALAALWMAHPPVAAWATLVAAAAGLVTVARSRSARVLAWIALAAAGFAVLSGFLFVSVHELALPVHGRPAALADVDYKMSILRGDWLNGFKPVSASGEHLLGDLQLGYGLWGLLLLAAWSVWGRRSGRALMLCFALLILFAWPIPGVTRLAWRSLPTELLVVTNQWPTERFYVLLAPLAAFATASAADSLHWRARTWAIVLLAACAWSVRETGKFFVRARAISHSEEASEQLHLPENIVLSRTHSFEYLGTPSFFPEGHIDPGMATRLIERLTRQVVADGTTLIDRSAVPSHDARSLVVRAAGAGGPASSLRLEPGRPWLLDFDFEGRLPVGELQIAGGTLYNAYALPSSGAPESFGASAGSLHHLVLENTTGVPEDVELRFVGSDAGYPGGVVARVRAEPLDRRPRVIELRSLTPFRATVNAAADSYLETPKLWIPGYRATVDGSPAAFARSPDGLVAVRVPRGSHDVRVYYEGSRWLRGAYYVSAGLWLALMGCVCGLAFLGPARGGFDARPVAIASGSAGWPAGWTRPACAAAAVALAAVTAAWVLHRPSAYDAGAIRMRIRLPWTRPGKSEPLVTTGRVGAGDFVYVTYVDGGHVVVGHDKWGYGGARSAPIAVDYEGSQAVEVSMTSLGAPKGGGLVVAWNGTTVLREAVDAYPSRASEVTVGENRIGGSTSEARFTGSILEEEPVRVP